MIYQTEQELNKALRQKAIQKVYLLYGQEAYLKEQYTKAIVKEVVASGTEGFNYNQFDSKKMDYNQLYDAVLSLPLMSPGRCVLVDDLDVDKLPAGDLKKLQQIMEETQEGTVLILRVGTAEFNPKKSSKCRGLLELADRLGGVICLDTRKEGALVQTIRTRCEKAGCNIENADALYLTERCSPELLVLLGEVDKLTAYCKGQTITRKDIDLVTTPTVDAQIYDLSKEILAKNYQGAMDSLSKLLYLREPESKILFTLTGAFVDLYRAKIARHSGMAQGDIVRSFGYPKALEFRVRNALRDCQKYSLRFLKRSLEILADGDYEMKSSRMDSRTILERSITEIFIALQEEGRH